MRESGSSVELDNQVVGERFCLAWSVPFPFGGCGFGMMALWGLYCVIILHSVILYCEIFAIEFNFLLVLGIKSKQ